MRTEKVTREEMWAKQRLSASEVDYGIWERDKAVLHQMSKLSRSCMFVVDVHTCRYAFASFRFVDLLGYDSHKIATLEKQGDYLESRIHPDDRSQLEALQVSLAKFIYSLPPGQRNDYCNIYGFRVRNAKQQYVQVVSKHQVLEQSRNGKAWLILGSMDIAPAQKASGRVDCTVLNLGSGELFSPVMCAEPEPPAVLSPRELEILLLIRRGFLSKEIAHKLDLSIYTVHNHRKNILAKLHVDTIIEAINKAGDYGIIG